MDGAHKKGLGVEIGTPKALPTSTTWLDAIGPAAEDVDNHVTLENPGAMGGSKAGAEAFRDEMAGTPADIGPTQAMVVGAHPDTGGDQECIVVAQGVPTR